MKIFKVALSRIYIVSIRAENEQRAKTISEFYLGDCPDLSTDGDRSGDNFQIKEIEMVYNEVTEILDELAYDESKMEN